MMNTLVTKESILTYNFDEVIIATGALPIIPSIEGIHNDNVYVANELLSYNQMFNGKKVLVLGAGLVGAECAEILGERGNGVTIVDMLNCVAPLAVNKTRNPLLQHLKDFNVTMKLNSKVLKINSDGIDCMNHDEIKTLSGFDYIVCAFGSYSNNELCEDGYHLIGDALKVSDAKKAIYEATKLALKL